MRRLLRKDSIIRVAAIVTGVSCLLFNNRSLNYKTNVSVSIPEPLRDELCPPWQTVQGKLPQPLFGPSYHWQNASARVLPLFSSRQAQIPPSDVKRDSGVSEQKPKPCCGCLGRNTIANAAACASPAVVRISIPRDKKGAIGAEGSGSGTIIDKDGTILTCAHVVKEGKNSQLHITLQDGRTFVGSVMNFDTHSDIAIVKINSKTPLPAAKLGSSTKLQPGDWVLAMGSPLSLHNTVTVGTVSCVDRKSSDLGFGPMWKEYLQIDCAVNPGNSGGPVVNIDGEVVGVFIIKLDYLDGLSFAVPIDTVTKIIEQFKKSGRVVRPWLGLKMRDLNEMIIAQLKERYPEFPNVEKGIIVALVTPKSPGDRAGFLPGDVILEFDGKPVASMKEIIEIMGDRIGVPLKAVVKRANDKQVRLTVVPEEDKAAAKKSKWTRSIA